MNAMILKELRENAKWALLGALGLSIALFMALLDGGMSYSIANETFQLTTQFGFAGLAVLLAVAQTMPEQWRDRWSFLVHRPVTRTQIFFAKFATGGALYALACGVPLLIVYAWATSSLGRREAPVVPEMLQPALAD